MSVIKRLFSLLTPYWTRLLVSGFLLLCRAAMELVPPLFHAAIIDNVVGTRDLSGLGLLVGGLIGVYALQELTRSGDLFLRHALGERFIFDLRVRLYSYLQQLSLSFFEGTSTGELMSRVTSDVNSLEQFVTHGSALTVIDLLRLVGAAAILFTLEWRLARAAYRNRRRRGGEPSADAPVIRGVGSGGTIIRLRQGPLTTQGWRDSLAPGARAER